MVAWVLQKKPETKAKENVPTAKPHITQRKKHNEPQLAVHKYVADKQFKAARVDVFRDEKYKHQGEHWFFAIPAEKLLAS